jgi:hypothetical protein
MYQEIRIMKLNQLLFTPNITVLTRNGTLSTSKTMLRMLLRVITRNLDSISIDHSTLFHNSHSEESWNVLVLTMQSLRDGSRTDLPSNSSSMKRLRLSDLNNGRITQWRSNPMEDQPTSDSLQASTQDGGNCSDMTTLLKNLSITTTKKIRVAKFWTLMVTLMLKTETSSSNQDKNLFPKSGSLSMLMNIQMSQRRVR